MKVDLSAPAVTKEVADWSVEIPVESSWLATVAYHAERAILQVTLRSGAVYQYLQVPQPTFLDLLQADSVGGYLNRHIRKRFVYVLLRQP